MPQGPPPSTETGYIRDILRRLRQLPVTLNTLRDVDPTGITDGAVPTWDATTKKYTVAAPGEDGSHTPIPHKDTFTVAASPSTTYTLTYPPLADSLNLSVNGLELEEGVDYTVNTVTDVVTISETLKTDDLITADYWTTGALIASAPINDTFDRTTGAFTSTNDTVTSGNAQWTDVSPAGSSFGIDSNQRANSITTGGGGGSADLSVTASKGTVTVDLYGVYTFAPNAISGVTVLQSSDGQNGITLLYDGNHVTLTINKPAGSGGDLQVYSGTPANGSTYELAFDTATTTVTLTVNGTVVYTDSSGGTGFPPAPGTIISIFGNGTNGGIDTFNLTGYSL